MAKAAPAEPKLVALAELVSTCDTARAALGETPTAREVGELWRAQDALHGKRADYQLWRQLRGGDRIVSKPDVAAAFALRGLEAPSPQVRWAALAMLPAMPESVLSPALVAAAERVLKSGTLLPAPQTGRLVAWLAESWLTETTEGAAARLQPLAELLAETDPTWKVGRAHDLSFLEKEKWLPVEQAVALRWLGRAVVRWVRAGGEPWLWQLTAWRIRCRLREEGRGPTAGEVEMLLDAGCLARRAGDPAEALRWTALAVALLPPRAPARLMQRCKVEAWRMAEIGVWLPAALAVRLDQVPFSGEPPDSDAGRAAADCFADEWDVSRAALRREVETEADWQVLREAGVVLNHPLAALAWIGKKAVAHAVKKQHDLLEAATRLASQHGALVSAGKMLAAWPGRADAVLAYAEALRRTLRQMPLLRDAVAWKSLLASLRTAWGRLEPGAIGHEESLFLLHETLVDRLETTRRCLPEPMRGWVAAVGASDETMRAGALEIEHEPRLMAALEHQRTLELWEIAALLREREELAGCVWISVVALGDPAAGRYHFMVQGPAGREQGQGKAVGASLIAELAAAAQRCGSEITTLLLALDDTLPTQPWQAELASAGLTAQVVRVPSWEAAFRALREWNPIHPFPLS